MLEVKKRGTVPENIDLLEIDEVLLLDHMQRRKGRLRVASCSGQWVGLFLQRGKSLSVGEVLLSSCGKTILIDGAREEVVTAQVQDWQVFSRACYHLGNRHVMLQLGDRWLRFKPDHVLEELVQNLGLSLYKERAVFEPEDGAYSQLVYHHAH